MQTNAKMNTPPISLVVLGPDNKKIHYILKKNAPLANLINDYCNRQDLHQPAVRFRFDGMPINPNDTPQSLSMSEGDYIEVYLKM